MVDAINQSSTTGEVRRGARGPAVVRAQVLLDRAWYSPGEIDGRDGENVKKAIAAFERAQGLQPDGKLDAATWAKLIATSNEPVITEYTITNEDVKGPFLKTLPSKLEDMQDLEHLGYTSVSEAIAEQFHMSEKLLKTLNPGKTLDVPDTKIAVINLGGTDQRQKVEKIEINKPGKLLTAYGKDGQVMAIYPASIGSKEKPAPTGSFKVTSVAQNPTYKYNPEYRFKGVKASKPFMIKPGPNNPVGSVWISLSLKGYGIHGTPDPSKVSKTESHGCIRLTNWDVKQLASMVEKGTPVVFLEESSGYDAMASHPEKRMVGRQGPRRKKAR
jgi:lipoprotein-anchoring transpeptidase ErfK/SrfK